MQLILLLLLCACAGGVQPVVFANQPTPTAFQILASVATPGASLTPLPVSTSTKDLSILRSQSNTPTPDASIWETKLVEALRRGGYVIYIHSAESDQTQTGANVQNLENCPRQSTLDGQAQIDARAIGASFQALGIPVGQVLYSASCSSRDTAMLMFGRGEDWAELSKVSTILRGERIKALRLNLSTPPQSGTNTVFVGHGLDITDVTGIKFAEDEAAIYKPLGEIGYSLAARILPKAWNELEQNTTDLVKLEPYVSDSIPLEKIEPSHEPDIPMQSGAGGQNQIVPPGQSPAAERDLLLPDLITLPPTDLSIRVIRAKEQKLLRFTNSIINLGPGRMELWGSAGPNSGKKTVTQYIYDSKGSTEKVVVGEFFFHPQHNHWHLGDFSVYEIWSLGPDGGLDSVVALGNKISYCLRDDARSGIPGAASQQTYTNCNQEMQGISVGWIDIYQYHLEGQSIDISSLPDGVYALRSIVNPENKLREGDSTNNAAILYFEIEGDTLNIVESPDISN